MSETNPERQRSSSPVPGVLPEQEDEIATEPSEATLLLEAHSRGETGALDRLVDLVYDDLRRIARSQLRKRSGRRELETTALVSEAYLRLVNGSGLVGSSRDHFLAVCARAMRFVLIDFARERSAQKRGGNLVVETLEEGLVGTSGGVELSTILALHAALEDLQDSAPRLVQVVECRYFAGLSLDETAAALSVSTRTVERDWRLARARLLVLLHAKGSEIESPLDGAAQGEVPVGRLTDADDS